MSFYKIAGLSVLAVIVVLAAIKVILVTIKVIAFLLTVLAFMVPVGIIYGVYRLIKRFKK